MTWSVDLHNEVRFSLRENKTLVRAVAAGYVPAEVLRMPKKGFNLPLSEWTLQQKDLAQLARQKIDNLKNRGVFRNKTVEQWWQRRHQGMFHLVWLLVNTETWLETYVDERR